MSRVCSQICRHLGMPLTDAVPRVPVSTVPPSEDCQYSLKRLAVTKPAKLVILGAFLCLLIPVLLGGQQQNRWHAKLMPPPAECMTAISTSRLDLPTAREDGGGWWLDFSDRLANETAEANIDKAFDVLFYGDSITEMWRGSIFGVEMPSLQGIKEIFRTHFNKEYLSNSLGVTGDVVVFLWWRLLHGQMPKVNQPKAVVLLVGTNDLTFDDCLATEMGIIAAVPGIVSRVKKVLALMRKEMPNTHIVLLGLLPRDTDMNTKVFEWPNRMSRAIALANYDYERLAKDDDHIHFLDCGQAFVTPTGLNRELFSDGIHPGPKGMEALANCLQATVDALVLQSPETLKTDADSAEVMLESDKGKEIPSGWSVSIVPNEGK